MGWKVPFFVEEKLGLDREEYVRGGIPFKKKVYSGEKGLVLNGGMPVQSGVLKRWPDGSVKWLLVDFKVKLKAKEKKKFLLSEGENQEGEIVEISEDKLRVLDGLELIDKKGRRHEFSLKKKTVVREGSQRSMVRAEGIFKGVGVDLKARFNLYKDGLLKLDLEVHNPRRAEHKNGFWDLGDKGSVLFKDLSLRLKRRGNVYYKSERKDKFKRAGSVRIYQDSSGKKNWRSKNHVNRNNKVKTSFKGYRVFSKGIKRGGQAQPVVKKGGLSVAVKDFWQNFPKALEADGGEIVVRLFPRYYKDLYELQGGEKKNHTIYIDFKGRDLSWVERPLVLKCSGEYYEETGVMPYFSSKMDERYEKLVKSFVNNFKGRNDGIDEYGWRNFGDAFADHEAVHEELISHYNNQYDMVYGCVKGFLRTGKERWFWIMNNMAKHVREIDIYHTEGDKAAYNGGLFWHTFHYTDAFTSTHRSYSKLGREQMEKFSYGVGGGPGDEHNYARGLLYHYFLTGEELSKEAVLSLADWVIKMDGFWKGKASQTGSLYYHGPGRGSGNSINALLDGFELTSKGKYLRKVEELVKRCVHPRDEISRWGLEDVEHRWSYLVFLQALGRYLDVKLSLGEEDRIFYYGRESLLHYAEWMLENEVPYKEILDKVDIPSATWIAHDIRKSNVFDFAYKYSGEEKFRKRSKFFFDRCVEDLSEFEGKELVRPLSILMNFAGMHDFFENKEFKVGFKKKFNFKKRKTFKPRGYYLYKLRDLVRRFI